MSRDDRVWIIVAWSSQTAFLRQEGSLVVLLPPLRCFPSFFPMVVIEVVAVVVVITYMYIYITKPGFIGDLSYFLSHE